MSFTVEHADGSSLLHGPEMGKLMVPLKLNEITPLHALMCEHKP